MASEQPKEIAEPKKPRIVVPVKAQSKRTSWLGGLFGGGDEDEHQKRLKAEYDREVLLDPIRTASKRKGFLFKKPVGISHSRGWKRRLFVLRENSLCYFEGTEQGQTMIAPWKLRGSIQLSPESKVHLANFADVKFGFEVVTGSATCRMHSSGATDTIEWVYAIRSVISILSKTARANPSEPDPFDTNKSVQAEQLLTNALTQVKSGTPAAPTIRKVPSLQGYYEKDGTANGNSGGTPSSPTPSTLVTPATASSGTKSPTANSTTTTSAASTSPLNLPPRSPLSAHTPSSAQSVASTSVTPTPNSAPARRYSLTTPTPPQSTVETPVRRASLTQAIPLSSFSGTPSKNSVT